MNQTEIKVGIVGGTGYTGVELLRLLARHSKVKLHCITSRSELGTEVSAMFTSLRGVVDLKFSHPDDGLLDECELVFFATPNGVAMQSAESLLSKGIKVIDLSADFRIKDVNVWQQWYKMTHACPQLLNESVYGLPEANREKIRSAMLVANPGCYPTAVQLALIPLLEASAINHSSIIADCKSGVSGAGRKVEMSYLLSEASENFKAYSVTGHRHQPEIERHLSALVNKSVGMIFVPHLTPMIRGIHATLYVNKTSGVDVQSLFEARYRAEPFVDVLPVSSHPETRSVKGANTCRIAIHQPQGKDTLVILSVIDNLIKGASGQAVQNMNIMFGFPETDGLEQLALVP